MQLPALAWCLLACIATQVSATALTYKLTANEKACFYAATQKKEQKIAFYFAVPSPFCLFDEPDWDPNSNL